MFGTKIKSKLKFGKYWAGPPSVGGDRSKDGGGVMGLPYNVGIVAGCLLTILL